MKPNKPVKNWISRLTAKKFELYLKSQEDVDFISSSYIELWKLIDKEPTKKADSTPESKKMFKISGENYENSNPVSKFPTF